MSSILYLHTTIRPYNSQDNSVRDYEATLSWEKGGMYGTFVVCVIANTKQNLQNTESRNTYTINDFKTALRRYNSQVNKYLKS
jgi:hypothetical protein